MGSDNGVSRSLKRYQRSHRFAKFGNGRDIREEREGVGNGKWIVSGTELGADILLDINSQS